MTRYRKEFIIPYYDSDKNGFVQAASLLTYMGETSSFHSDSLGVGIENLRKNNYGWMLNRWRVKFFKYPRVRDKIIIETWNSGFNKFYATREFIIYDENLNEIVRATTQWIFLDITTKRPKRVPQEFSEVYGLETEKMLHDFYDFNPEFITETNLDFNVRKSDIDYNNHVNNVKYLNWMDEVIPVSVDNNYRLDELDIQYKKEVKLGGLISSSIVEKKDEEKLTYLHKIIEEDEVHAYGRTKWKKINPL